MELFVFSKKFAVLIAGLLAAVNACFATNSHSWIEVRSPHFIVVSNANEHDARRVAEQFEIVRAVFRENFGIGSIDDQPIVILAAKDEETLRPLLPEAWTKKGAAHRTGVYLNGLDKSYVGLRLDVSLDRVYEPYEPIYHEYIHHLMRGVTPTLPRWMVEGLAEFYGNLSIESNRVLLGTPSTTNVMLLRERAPLPLSTLFDVDASSPYYNEESKVSIFYAESWALTHYLMLRDWQEKAHRVSDFTSLIRQNIPQMEAAKRTIGDPEILEKALGEYIRRFSFTTRVLPRPQIENAKFQTRPLTDAEALSVRGDFMAHIAKYAEARTTLEESLNLDPKLATTYENMSFVSFRQGKVREVEKWSQQALVLNPQSHLANYYYAMSVLYGGPVDSGSMAKAEASFRAAIKSNPQFVPSYAGLAELLSRPGPWQKLDEAYMMVLQAVEREPRNMQYRIEAVSVLERMGRAEDAIRVATLAVSLARTPEEGDKASAALAGARQFQISQKKMKELENEQASSEPPGQSNSSQQKGAAPSAPGPIQVLTDTMGVNFNPYLSRVLHVVKQNWYTLMSESVSSRKGKVVLEFSILKSGSVAGLKIISSSGDVLLDRPAFGSITASNPFPPLPKEFPGPYLGLSFTYYYNLNVNTTTPPGPRNLPYVARDCTVEDYLTTSLTSDGGTTLSIAPTGPVKLLLSGKQKFSLTEGSDPVTLAHWELSGDQCKISDCGSMSGVGLYTAPATMPAASEITLTATETREPCKTSSVKITLVAAEP